MTVVPATRPAEELEAELLALLVQLFESTPSADVENAIAALTTAAIAAPPAPQPRSARRRPIPAEERPWAAWRVRIIFAISFVVVGIPIFWLMLWFWHHSSPAHGLAAEIVDGSVMSGSSSPCPSCSM